MRLLKDMENWTIKLHVIGRFYLHTPPDQLNCTPIFFIYKVVFRLRLMNAFLVISKYFNLAALFPFSCYKILVFMYIGIIAERWEKSSNQNKWELTKPLPLDDDSTSLVALLGPKPDVHYIYVCVKVSLQLSSQNVPNSSPKLFVIPFNSSVFADG